MNAKLIGAFLGGGCFALLIVLGLFMTRTVDLSRSGNERQSLLRSEISQTAPVLRPTPTPTPYWKTKTMVLFDDKVAIPAGKMHRVRFTVFDRERVAAEFSGLTVTELAPAKITGKFTVEGGSRDDIEALLLDEDEFENWSRGNRFRQYYQSGRITVGSIDVTLKPGTYYLIFSNGFSMFSNKVVSGKISMDVQMLIQP